MTRVIRKARRILLNTPVIVHHPVEPKSFEATSENVSVSGMTLTGVDQPLPFRVEPNDFVQIKLTFPHIAQPIIRKFQFAWISPSAPWRAGGAFTETLPPIAIMVLMELARRELTGT